MRRTTSRAVQGLFLAVGAPLGWLIIRSASGASLAAELTRNTGLYLYLALATAAVFAVFGYILGHHEERLVRTNRQLDELAITDSLTGLRNARYYHARLDEQHAASRRSGCPFAVIVLDLDFFKKINDSHGHMVGDLVLAGAAKAIAANARHDETAARVGGEEFALLMPGSTLAEAREAAERIRRAISEMTITIPANGEGNGEETIAVTASAGVASTSRLPGLSAKQLFLAADEALYAAKREGRNRTVEAVEGMGEAAVEAAEIEAAGTEAMGRATWEEGEPGKEKEGGERREGEVGGGDDRPEVPDGR